MHKNKIKKLPYCSKILIIIFRAKNNMKYKVFKWFPCFIVHLHNIIELYSRDKLFVWYKIM